MTTKRNNLTSSSKIDLKQVVQELSKLRKPDSGVRTVSAIRPARGLSLLDMFAEEVRFLRSSGAQPMPIIMMLVTKLGIPADGPLSKGAVAIGKLLEDASDEPNYHNKQHVVEVIVAAYVLGLREKLPIYRVMELIIGAAAHDLGHTGRMNQHDYERESISFQIAEPILKAVPLAPDSIARIEKMIMATDFRVGVPPARNEYVETHSLPNGDERKMLASQCLLLTEADVLFSCFDLHYNDLLSKLLSAEWQRPSYNLSLKERIGFLDRVRFISFASVALGLESRRLALLDQLNKMLASSTAGTQPASPQPGAVPNP